MFVYYNPNPCRKTVGDCVIRAVSVAENVSWDEAYISLCVFGYIYCNWGNGTEAWSGFLKYRGYRQYALPNRCPICYTVKDFCHEYPHGIFILGAGSHAVTVIDGDYYDAWDSGDEVIDRYFTREW